MRLLVRNPTKGVLFRGKRFKPKKKKKKKAVSPPCFCQSKQPYQRSTYSHQQRREEKNAPLTDTACQAARADLLKKRPLSLSDSLPKASPLFFCHLPSIYVSILLKKAASVYCQAAVGDSVPCWCVCACGEIGGRRLWFRGLKRVDGAVTCQTTGMLMPRLW